MSAAGLNLTPREPHIVIENLTMAFGCTGGRHRSVAISEEVARRLGRQGFFPAVLHRDADK